MKSKLHTNEQSKIAELRSQPEEQRREIASLQSQLENLQGVRRHVKSLVPYIERNFKKPKGLTSYLLR